MSESRAARSALISQAFIGRRQATDTGARHIDVPQSGPFWPTTDEDPEPIADGGNT